MQSYAEHWGNDLAKLTIFGYWGDDLAKLIIFRYWLDDWFVWEIFHFHEIHWGDAARLLGGIHSPPLPPGFAPIELPKNIGKSRDKS